MSPCSFTAPCSQSVYTFISFMYSISNCIASSHKFRRKRRTCHTVVLNLIVIGHFCRTWFFHCWCRFKRLRTASSSQRLPQPKYHCHNTVLCNMTPTVQTWRDCCVSLHNSCLTSSNSRHKTPKSISLHKPLHSEANFQSVGVQGNVLEQLANGMCPSSTSCVTDVLAPSCIPKI